jgi:YfiH family protein
MMKMIKGYSTRKDGSMYLKKDEFDVNNLKNRKRFFTARRLADDNIIAAHLVHGTRVAVVNQSSAGFILDTDALITNETGIALTITGADCFPVYFEEKRKGIIGIAHCGWRGIVAGIIPNIIQEIVKLGGTIEDIYMTIGPGICKNHFEVQSKDLESFADFPTAIVSGETVTVNLKKIIIEQARAQGMPRKHMTEQKECTYCDDEKYFSYRRDKPEVLQTQVAYITMHAVDV